MPWFVCPYLRTEVELNEERHTHIATEHADFAPFIDRIAGVLAAPSTVRRSSSDPQVRLFSCWYDDVADGMYVVVVVVADPAPSRRHWIITAYMTHSLTGGTIEWTAS